jgi:Fe2+ or Zn2+ uptake regulation protein
MTATAYAVDVVQMEKGVIALNVVIDMVKKLICKNCGKTIEFVIQKEYRNKKGYWRDSRISNSVRVKNHMIRGA